MKDTEITPDTFRRVADLIRKSADAWERAIQRNAKLSATPQAPQPTPPAKPVGLPTNVVPMPRRSVIHARACPACRAPIGRPCRDGSRTIQPHRARKNA